MKLERRYKKRESGKFSNRVEVTITGLDEKGKRMSKGWRRSLRVGDTTLDEVYDIVFQAIEEHCKEE